jgi:hypothetical protein
LATADTEQSASRVQPATQQSVSDFAPGAQAGEPVRLAPVDAFLPPLSKAAGEAPVGEPSRFDNMCFQASSVNCTGGQTTTQIITFSLPYIEDNERQPACVPTTTAYGNSEWFKFQAGATGVTIHTCDPNVVNVPLIPDTAIEVYSGECPAANLTALACNNDRCPGVLDCCLNSTYGVDYSGLGSFVEVGGLTIGIEYIFQVGVIGWHAGTNYEYPMGDYVLTLICSDPQPCAVPCPPGATDENEFSPGAETSRVNDGCDMSTYNDGLGTPPVAFAEIDADETVCGTSYQDFGADPDHDSDWYRLWLPPGGPYQVAVTAEAEFGPDVRLLAPATGPDPCDNPVILAQDADNGECDPLTLTVPGLAPGEYWIYIAPQIDGGNVEGGRRYVLSVDTTPNVPEASVVGACCYESGGARVCAQLTKADCLALTRGVYFGDGVSCDGGAICATCPPGAIVGVDDECFNNGSWQDTVNFGCGQGSQSALTSWAEGDTVCGFGGTHIPTTLENLRDNDWWSVAISEPSKIIVDGQAEFPCMLVVWEMGCNPIALCETFTPLDWGYFDRGVPFTWSTCVYGRNRTSDPNDPGNIYCASLPGGSGPFPQTFAVTIRSSLRGTPRELPCGLPYYMSLDLDQCGPGACCLGVQGCVENYDYALCVTSGGTFGGEGSMCADICCPCEAGDTAEGEPNCGEPNDTTNGGCWGSDPPYYFGSITNGESICGTHTYFDHDWYEYNHPGGLLSWQLVDDYVSRTLVLYNSTQPGTCASTLQGWEFFTTADCDPEGLLIDADPRVYWLVTRADDTDVTCGRLYQATVRSFTTGACCFPDGTCSIEEEADCILCGTYLGDDVPCTESTPGVPGNPCCDVSCVYDEGEANCSPPPGGDTVNGGCNSTPPVFGTQLANSGDTVCGTVAIFETSDGRTRDMDWYQYNHTTGDLVFCVDSEFAGVMWILFPTGTPPCGDLVGWSTTIAPNCGGTCLRISETNPDLTPNQQYILLVAPDFDEINLVDCGIAYSAYAYSEVTGVCCIGQTCEKRTPSECVALGGVYQGLGNCDVTSTCCTIQCTDTENEVGCGFPPNPQLNGGCSFDPPEPFTPINANATACGSSGLIDNGDGTLSRDVDWYEYQHAAAGDFTVKVASQFLATVIVLKAGPAGSECADSFGCVYGVDGNCDLNDGAFTWTNADAGTYYVFVAIDWDNDLALCPTQYQLRVEAGVQVPYCMGDSNCSLGSPTFTDVQYFVAALSGEASWVNYHTGQTGNAPPANCPYLINDMNGYLPGGTPGVEFSDIQDFVAAIGQPCIPYQY